jgi:cytochrome c oxidase assembly protein subunit 11
MPRETGSWGEAPAVDRLLAIPAEHRRLVLRLLLVVAGSIAFTLALVPLYNVLCAKAGLNGRATEDTFRIGGFNADAGVRTIGVDLGRSVTVQFTGTVMPGLPWQMQPLTRSAVVHPGELQVVKFLVRNLSNHTVAGQAIPGVTPGQAARYFHKIQCFCFAHQSMAPHEEREMAVAFIIRPDLDPDVSELTLAYAFFPLTPARVAAISPSPTARSVIRS